MDATATVGRIREPWNKGKLVGQKAPLKVKDIWAIRVRLQMEGRNRDLALFDLGIDSKLRACDLVKLRVRDICRGDRVASRAMVMQQKTQHPVQFEITPATQEAVQYWIKASGRKADDWLFPSRVHSAPHLGTRQYARIVHDWVDAVGLDRRHMVRIPSAARSRRSSIGELETYGQFSCFWGIPRSRAQLGTSASMSTTRWSLRSRLRFRGKAAGRRAGHVRLPANCSHRALRGIAVTDLSGDQWTSRRYRCPATKTGQRAVADVCEHNRSPHWGPNE